MDLNLNSQISRIRKLQKKIGSMRKTLPYLLMLFVPVKKCKIFQVFCTNNIDDLSLCSILSLNHNRQRGGVSFLDTLSHTYAPYNYLIISNFFDPRRRI